MYLIFNNHCTCTLILEFNFTTSLKILNMNTIYFDHIHPIHCQKVPSRSSHTPPCCKLVIHQLDTIYSHLTTGFHPMTCGQVCGSLSWRMSNVRGIIPLHNLQALESNIGFYKIHTEYVQLEQFGKHHSALVSTLVSASSFYPWLPFLMDQQYKIIFLFPKKFFGQCFVRETENEQKHCLPSCFICISQIGK